MCSALQLGYTRHTRNIDCRALVSSPRSALLWLKLTSWVTGSLARPYKASYVGRFPQVWRNHHAGVARAHRRVASCSRRSAITCTLPWRVLAPSEQFFLQPVHDIQKPQTACLEFITTNSTDLLAQMIRAARVQHAMRATACGLACSQPW